MRDEWRRLFVRVFLDSGKYRFFSCYKVFRGGFGGQNPLVANSKHTEYEPSWQRGWKGRTEAGTIDEEKVHFFKMVMFGENPMRASVGALAVSVKNEVQGWNGLGETYPSEMHVQFCCKTRIAYVFCSAFGMTCSNKALSRGGFEL
eukprot:Gb_00305 [translate_table: standard]